VPIASDPVSGRCDDPFRQVRDAFAENFESRGETGAALCIAIAGHMVVDLWGGFADIAQTRPWKPDTLVNVFSVGKAFTAVCVARMVGQGRLDLEDRVATHWPEFAARGKQDVTIRQLLSHQAGVPAVSRRLPPGAMFDWQLMTSALAEQEPWWPPGTAHGYHVNTFGFLVGEVVRRIDGRSLGRYLYDEVTAPLGADFRIGLPASEESRVAEFIWTGPTPGEEAPAGITPDRLMEYNAYFNPSGLSGAGTVNTRAWHEAEIPSTNGHGTARGVARLYQALAAGGTIDGVEVVDQGVLVEAASEQVNGEDRVLHRPTRFGLGFQLTQKERPLGPGSRGFGHFGAGGSVGFCDPEAGLAFGYVGNQMGPRWQNPRNRALIDAAYDSLGVRTTRIESVELEDLGG
jgi:CubicO group peptidase (beta-lactamase class C family)